MDEQFEREIASRFEKMREITNILKQVYHQRLYTNGNIREAYTEVLRNELFRLMREIDEFKMRICESMADIDAEAIMNVSRFPNMSATRQTTDH